MGRSLKPLDWPQIELAIQAGVAKKKIAEIMNIDEVTLHRRVKAEYGIDYVDFASSLQKKGETLLEVAMFQKALNEKSPGSVQMLQFLARCRLGMREPDILQREPANQQQIDQSHIIMQLRNKVAELEAKTEARTQR